MGCTGCVSVCVSNSFIPKASDLLTFQVRIDASPDRLWRSKNVHIDDKLAPSSGSLPLFSVPPRPRRGPSVSEACWTGHTSGTTTEPNDCCSTCTACLHMFHSSNSLCKLRSKKERYFSFLLPLQYQCVCVKLIFSLWLRGCFASQPVSQC